MKALIDATYAIRRTDQATKGSAALGMWKEVRPSLMRLRMLKAADLRRMHLQLFKHCVSGMQGRRCHNPGTLVGMELGSLMKMDREYLFKEEELRTGDENPWTLRMKICQCYIHRHVSEWGGDCVDFHIDPK